MSNEALVEDQEELSEFDAAFAEHATARETVELAGEEDIDGEETLDAAEPESVEEDPLDGLTDAQRAKYDELLQQNTQLNHQIASDAGRVSAFQKKVNTLQSEIEEIRQGSTAGPSKVEIADAMKGTDDDWEQFSSDYPEVASAIDKRLAQTGEATANAVEQTLKPIKERAAIDAATAEQQAAQKKVDELAQVYKDWTSEVKKPEFMDWLNQQPPGIKALTESETIADASALIGLYDSHLVANGKPSIKNDPTPGVKNPEPPGSKPSNLEEKRKRQLEAAAAIPSKRANVDASGPVADEFTTAFEHFARRREAQRATT